LKAKHEIVLNCYRHFDIPESELGTAKRDMVVLSLFGVDSVLLSGEDDALVGGKSLKECLEGGLAGAMVSPPDTLDHDYTRCVGWQRDVGF